MLSDLGPAPIIIDDANAHHYARAIQDASTPFTGGYIPRDYDRFPFGTVAPPTSITRIQRREWDDHIRRQEAEKSSPDHWRLAAKVPVLDQNGLGYCWAYGVVGAVMVCYAQQGLPVPHLSATSVAAQGKNWRNEGGWGGEAIDYIARFGIAELDVWPEHSMDRSLPSRHDVQQSAQRHDVVAFEELPREDFEALVSVLLDPQDPRPVTLGLNWWGHLVYAVKVVALGGGKYGIKIVNSWKPSWGNQGTAILSERKATAFEQIAVRRVKPRSAE